MFTFIYLDVNTLRLFSYILFVLTSADFRPPSTYIYREQPKSKSDSPKNFHAQTGRGKRVEHHLLIAMPGHGLSHIPAHTLKSDSQSA